MKKQTIGFLGVGNMGQSLIKGLVLNGYPVNQLFACDHNLNKLESLSADNPGMHTSQDSHALIQQSSVLVLAIKPQGLQATLSELSPLILQHKPLVVSIAAGITSEQIQRWVKATIPLQIIRAMPNTPALLQAGITGLYADSSVTQDNKNMAEELFASVGETVWIDKEDLMDVVTALSGSGPAYFFYILEAFTQSAVKLGLPLKTAQSLITHTMLGASKMAIACEDLALLRQKVTSPGGTTQAGIEALEQKDLMSTLAQAIIAATERGKALKDNNS